MSKDTPPEVSIDLWSTQIGAPNALCPQAKPFTDAAQLASSPETGLPG